ncbi:MAG: hypothetical protein IJT22_02485 [Synergistaceae bacterium]|nr:hypothetical protein [Synergistaceae bacterium]
MKKLLFALVLILVFAAAAQANVRLENGMYIVDDAEGFAPVVNGKKAAAREEAKRRAYRDAVEKAIGACVTGITEMENFEVTRDKVFSKSAGIVKSFEVIKETVDEDGVLNIKGVCKVAEKALDGMLGPDVIASLGNPRVMILIDERVGDEVPFISAVESETLRIFERAGYLIVDPEQTRTLLRMDPKSAFSEDPVKLAEAAKTLKADIIIVGRAYANAFAKQKIHGITLYGVKGTVQLKAVLTKTAYQISSKTVEKATGKKPAQTVEGGAERCFKEATSAAADQIVYKIAYNMASAGSALGGVTVNIKISNINFSQVEELEEKLSELAGKSGEIFERDYSNNNLELDIVSSKTARNVASFLAENNIKIENVTAQTITGKFVAEPEKKPEADLNEIILNINNIKDFNEQVVIENALNEFTGGSAAGEYDGEANSLKIIIKSSKTAREIAGFLNVKDVEASEAFKELGEYDITAIKITGVSKNLINARAER